MQGDKLNDGRLTTKYMKRAYYLWLRYKTQCAEYQRIADSLGVSRLELNACCHELRQMRRRAV